MGLRILITNIRLWPPSGTVLYVRDLALELRRQGHEPMIFSLEEGGVARELRAAGVPVTGRLTRIPAAPDIIHGHHYVPTMLAVRHFTGVPAISICHDHTAVNAATPFHPRIRRYFGVSRVCVERMIDAGVSPDRAGLLLNFVDTQRFLPRPPLPRQPRTACVFSNYANEGTQLPAIREACRQAGLELTVVGAGAHNTTMQPETQLGRYDIVFAKAKAAMEAMAVGTAVVLCDFAGAGPMVTSAEFDALRPLNFGYAALRMPLTPEHILLQIRRYDAEDAARVRDRLRCAASLSSAAANLIDVYRTAIAEQKSASAPDVGEEPRLLRERAFWKAAWAWKSLPAVGRTSLETLLGIDQVASRIARWFIRSQPGPQA